jgi:hypothetical protein
MLYRYQPKIKCWLKFKLKLLNSGSEKKLLKKKRINPILLMNRVKTRKLPKMKMDSFNLLLILRLRLLLGRPSKLRIKLPPLSSKISMISKETQLNRKPEKLLRLGKLVEKPLKKREPLKLKSKSFYTQLIDKPPSLLGELKELPIKQPPLRPQKSMSSKETLLNRKPDKLLWLGKLKEMPLKKREPLKLRSKSLNTQLIDNPPSLLGELKELPIKQPPLKLNVSIGSRKRSINKRPKLLKKPEKLPTKPS